MADVVRCFHCPEGQCQQCRGRTVSDVPVAVYGAFCKTFADAALHAERLQRRPDLLFPAFVALVAGLGVAWGERLLDLGCGVGRAAVAWALLFPGCEAAGVEADQQLYEAATAASCRLSPEVQQRLRWHSGDPLECDWGEASVLLLHEAVLGAGADAAQAPASAQRLLERLRGVAAGARVVALSRPLPSGAGVGAASGPDYGHAPPGFALIGQAPHRSTHGGNTMAFVYRRIPD